MIAPWVSLEAPRDTGPARIEAEKRQMSSQGVSGSSAAAIALSSSSGVGEKAQRSSQQRRCQSFPFEACYGGQRCSVIGPIPSAAVPLEDREANANKSLRFALPVPRRPGREASELIEDSHHGSASTPDESAQGTGAPSESSVNERQARSEVRFLPEPLSAES